MVGCVEFAVIIAVDVISIIQSIDFVAKGVEIICSVELL